MKSRNKEIIEEIQSQLDELSKMLGGSMSIKGNAKSKKEKSTIKKGVSRSHCFTNG